MGNTPTSKTETDIGLDIEDELDDIELIRIELEQGRLFDKYGHEHSEAVFKNWAPSAVKSLGIHRVKDDEGAE